MPIIGPPYNDEISKSNEYQKLIEFKREMKNDTNYIRNRKCFNEY